MQRVSGILALVWLLPLAMLAGVSLSQDASPHHPRRAAGQKAAPDDARRAVGQAAPQDEARRAADQDATPDDARRASGPADLVLLGGTFATVDPRRPTAQAIAARGDRIVAVGSDREVALLIGPRTRVMRLAGKLVVPGFIEGHGHLVMLGESKMMLDLTRARSWDDIVRQVEAAAGRTEPGQWILGRGWHQEKWERPPEPNVEGYPTHEALSRVAPLHPVLLTHASGHMSVANAEAMRLAGVTSATTDPPGGQILRDAKGRPTGAFRETAQGFVHGAAAAAERRISQDERRQKLLRAIELATEECLAKGVTSFQDAGASLATIDALAELANQEKLRIRLWVMINEANDVLAARLANYRMVGRGNHHLTVRGIKRMIDGALGPHGAWLLAPYDDLPGSTGLQLTSDESLRRTAELAIRHGYQLCVHAIGDAANRRTLDLFEAVLAAHPSADSRRWRIEHAQHLHPDDVPRFARLGVIASMQANHATSDAVFVVRRLGLRRAEGAYAWRSLLDAGAVVTNGTDAPVEDVDPLGSFYASATRKLPDGTAFFPQQCMTREEALRSYTQSAAYAAFEEDIKGSLSVGKLADMVVLSHDILTCPEEDLRRARVECTIVGGQVRYTAP